MATKQDTLFKTYELYDDFSTGLTMACNRGCAACCTQNVTMTTLEGYHILRHLVLSGKKDLLRVIHHTAHTRRFQPKLSTNELADLCLRSEDPPDEHHDYPPVACPFLCRGECLIYEGRPFGCRCFFSTQLCEKEAWAVVDPFLITVNTVFLQFIEHVDAGGLFGNITDVLLFLEQENRRSNYDTKATLDHQNHPNDADLSPRLGCLVRNRAIPALFIPPEHHERLQPILKELGKIRTEPIRSGHIGRA